VGSGGEKPVSSFVNSKIENGWSASGLLISESVATATKEITGPDETIPGC
jgi:hypothetical protein